MNKAPAIVRENDKVRIALFNNHIYIHHYGHILRLYSDVTPASWRRVQCIQNTLPRSAVGLWRY